MSETDQRTVESDLENNTESNDIAIIGIACRLPGAQNPKEFWNNLRNGEESLTSLSDEELLEAGVSERELEDPNYVKAGMFLKDMECFDAGFFGFNPQEARIMDPQHRQFLQCAWETFENAGYVPEKIEGAVGVFAGSGHNAYMPYNLLPNKQILNDVGFFLMRHTGNDKDFLSTRASYLFNLKGPSVNVQTACSTSLVAVHMGAQSLLSGECDVALAGGVTIELPHRQGYLYKDSEILSKDGHCRPFEQASGGTLFGSGVGCVLLKRLDDALADGDHIHAILKASAINNDGSEKVSYLAPSVDGQAAAIREAIEIADIDPASVSFIECHGTGTQLGDPIEVAALTQAYGQNNEKAQYCGLGSVKSNIGHLDTAAGVAGMIKAILCLQARELVPTLHYNAPNPAIEFENSPFYVNDRLREWSSEGPRRAAVSSLGVGGTNAHVILEEAPSFEETEPTQHDIHLINLSAKTESSLNSLAKKFAAHCRDADSCDLADLAYTLNVGRKEFSHRLSLPVSSLEDAAEKLSDLSLLSNAKQQVHGEPSLVFMLPGGGAQYAGMGFDLYESESVYKEAFDACMDCIPDTVSSNVRELVFAEIGAREEATVNLQIPSLTLTALFATEYALAKQMMAWGAIPGAMIGHSMGENTAACLAGVMTLQDAMNLVLLRGQLFEKAPEGGMLSIPLPVEEVGQYISDELDIAAVNAPELCVVSGPKDKLHTLQRQLEESEISSTIVKINVAAHSRMLEGILDEFREYLRSIKLSAPEIPFTSNLSGTWITDDQATSPDYWVDHLRNTVKFSENIETVMQGGVRTLVEIGPGRTLTNLAKANLDAASVVVNSMRHPSEELSDTLVARQTLGSLWASGIEIDWSTYWGEELRFRLPLPTYSFDKTKHWIDPPAHSQLLEPSELRKKKNIHDWFAKQVWRQCDISGDALDQDVDHLVFANDSAFSTQTVKNLKQLDASCILVTKGDRFGRRNDQDFVLSSDTERDLYTLSELALEKSDTTLKLIYMWSLGDAEPRESSFWTLFYLLKVLGELDRPVELCIVSDGLYRLADESMDPMASLMLGPVLVASRELPGVTARIVDIRCEPSREQGCAEQLLNEISYRSEHAQVLYRGRQRWVRDIESVRLDNRVVKSDWLNPNSVVMITGGLGGIGLNIAQLLCEKGAQKIVLMSRHKLPPESDWEGLVDSLPDKDILKSQLRTLTRLNDFDTEIVTVAADVTDTHAMAQALSSANIQIDAVNVIVHAAGMMDDKLAMEKTKEEAEKVLSAKVRGAIALDTLFSGCSLDYFVVFSSVASYLGLPGQIDYTAANAFLDAFADERNERSPGKTVSINWSAWKEVGMAANSGSGKGSSYGLPMKDSLLERYIDDGQSSRIYSVLLDSQSDWLVAEHKTQSGFHLVPGTGFIELIRSAVAHFEFDNAETGHIEISDLNFLSAFEVLVGGSRELNVELERKADQIIATVFAEDADFPMVTAIAKTGEHSHKESDLSSILSRCVESHEVEDGYMDRTFMDFGPRWACIESIVVGQQEALITCALKEEYLQDFETVQLHPAMLDMATGCAQFLEGSFDKSSDFYVPIGYQAIKISGKMPTRFHSHVRLRGKESQAQLSFDVLLLDEAGNVFVEVTNFTMQKLDQGFASSLSDNDIASSEDDLSPEQERLAAILREAILPDEGRIAFDQFMSVIHDDTHCVIASIDTSIWQKQLREQFGEDSTDMTPSEIENSTHDPDADSEIPVIENVIREVRGVEEAIVRSFLDDDGDRRIIAFYIPDDWEPMTVTELRNEIKEKLSDELQPQQFVELDEWPETDTGEVDKKQLVDPFAPVDLYIAPRTSTEKKLEKIWGNILGVSRVSLNENFFDIGGHSLLSIRVIVKVKKEFGVRLDQAKMVLLTLKQMARDIDDQLGEVKEIGSEDPKKQDVQQPTNSQIEKGDSGAPRAKKGFFSVFKKGRG